MPETLQDILNSLPPEPSAPPQGVLNIPRDNVGVRTTTVALSDITGGGEKETDIYVNIPAIVEGMSQEEASAALTGAGPVQVVQQAQLKAVAAARVNLESGQPYGDVFNSAVEAREASVQSALDAPITDLPDLPPALPRQISRPVDIAGGAPIAPLPGIAAPPVLPPAQGFAPGLPVAPPPSGALLA